MVPDNIHISTPEFSSLRRTSRHIAAIGKLTTGKIHYNVLIPQYPKNVG